MKKLLLAFGVVVCWGSPVAAQIGSVPYTFSPGTTILSAEVNANFSNVYSLALNRTGGTMTGTLTTVTIAAAANNSYEIGASGTRFANVYSVLGNFSGTVTIGTISTSCTGCVTWANVSKSGSSLADLATRAVANLSDGSNVALLNAANTISVDGTQTFKPATDTNIVNARVGDATGNGFRVLRAANGTGTVDFGVARNDGATTGLTGTAFTGFLQTISNIPLAFGTNSTLRFQINETGDWLFGANIMDATGTPTVGSGFSTSPTIAGTDYAIKVTANDSTTGAGTVNFGHTWTTAPVCTASGSSDVIWVTTTTTTAVSVVTGDGSNFAAGGIIRILCRSY